MLGALTKCGILVAVVAVPGLAYAVDTWVDVAPGVRHFHRSTVNQEIDGAIIDLCAPGIDLRATASDERGRTVGSFGAAVGATVAINGDFFGSGYSTDGPTQHAGAAWGGTDHGYVGLLGIGPGRVELSHHANTGGIEPWMVEVVSGHPTIVDDGVDIDGSGDPLCSNRHPRTAIGISQDHRQLILLVVDGRDPPGKIGMTCLEVSAMMRELGAFDAINMDGGGSSTMWLSTAGVVNNPSDGRQRVVGNHLGVYASGSGGSPLCPSKPPRGSLDVASCETIAGWAQDEDAPDASIDVHVYIDGPPGSPQARSFPVTANEPRADLCDAIGSCDHGFTFAAPADLADSKPHPVWVYGIDPEGISNPVLGDGPKTIYCPAPDLQVKRHVVDGGIFDAWHMDRGLVAAIDDALLAGYPTGGPLGDPLRLVRGPSRPNVFAIMGGVRRHVQSGESMGFWRFPWEQIEDLTDAEVDAWPEGPPLPIAPFVAQGSGPEIYLLDVPVDGLADFPDEGDLVGDGVSGGCAAGGRGGARHAWVLLAVLAGLSLLVRRSRS